MNWFLIVNLVLSLNLLKSTPCPEGKIVTVRGVAFTGADDNRSVREAALQNAMEKAIETGAGIFIDSKTVIKDELLDSSILYSKKRGIINSYTILDEGETEDGYFVKLEACIALNILKDELGRLSRNDVIILIIQDYNDGQETVRGTEAHLTEKLKTAGFRKVIDLDFLSTEKDRVIIQKAQQRDMPSIRDVGLRYLANVAIIGKVNAEISEEIGPKLISAKAQVDLSVLEIQTGRVLCAISTTAGKAFGRNKEKACRAALQKAPKDIWTKLQDCIMSKVNTQPPTQ